jgi:hypothetical protein
MPRSEGARVVNQFGRLDLRGMKFGMLTVIKEVRGKRGKRQWICICDCQNEKPPEERETIVTRHDYLIHTNHPKEHCGCIRKGGLPTQFKQEYHIWNMMLRRCYNPSHEGYPNYGGRGITVCDRWKEAFAHFLEDMGKRPSPEHTLDRENSDGQYCKDNCRWATHKEQNRNKRNSIFLPHPASGISVPAAEVAEYLGVTYQTMRAHYIALGRWPTQQSTQTEGASGTSPSSAPELPSSGSPSPDGGSSQGSAT